VGEGYTSKFDTEIFRCQVIQTAVDEKRQFILDKLWYSQPVPVAEKCRNAVEPPCREDWTLSSVQDTLQLVSHFTGNGGRGTAKKMRLRPMQNKDTMQT